MKKISYIFIGILALSSFTSCSSDFLNQNPTSQPSQSSFWQRKSDFQSALAACFSSYYTWPGVMSQIIPCYDGLTDNANTEYDETTYGSSRTIAVGDLDPNTGGYVSGIYSHCYTVIGRVHQILENLETYKGSDMSDAERKEMVAQCKAMRAYAYSWLYQNYREVPLVLQSLTMENMYEQPKATREAIKAQILKDYDEAYAAMSDGVYKDADKSGKFTKGAILGLKARLLLFDAYDDKGNAVKTKMQEIIPVLEAIKGYGLAKSTRENFVSSKQLASPEIMYSVRYLGPNYTNDMDLYYGNWNVMMPTRDLVDAFECTDGKAWKDSPLAVHPDESKLKAKGNASTPEIQAEREKLFKNRDRRLAESIAHGALAFTEFADNSDAPAITATLTGFNMVKLVQPTKTMPDYSTVCDVDVVVLRYAHVLLMLAEAENEVNGATAKALKAINEVRTRSGQPEIAAGISQAGLRERIRNEWRVETCFEGLRYYQLKRWHLLEQKVNGFEDPANPGYKKVVKPAFYFFPIPQGEIDKAGGKLVQDSNYK